MGRGIVPGMGELRERLEKLEADTVKRQDLRALVRKELAELGRGANINLRARGLPYCSGAFPRRRGRRSSARHMRARKRWLRRSWAPACSIRTTSSTGMRLDRATSARVSPRSRRARRRSTCAIFPPPKRKLGSAA